jgi:dihydrofolate reductase
MQVSVFVGVSIDGFIARPDGRLDFLAPFEGEEHGYEAHMRSIDALVVGRATWETIRGFAAWPWNGKRVIVLTHRTLEAAHGEETHSGPLAPLAARLAAEGIGRVYLDGGVAIRGGLDEDLVDDMTITTVPRTIGAGIGLFGGGQPTTTAWRVARVTSFPSGMVQVRWERAR